MKEDTSFESCLCDSINLLQMLQVSSRHHHNPSSKPGRMQFASRWANADFFSNCSKSEIFCALIRKSAGMTRSAAAAATLGGQCWISSCQVFCPSPSPSSSMAITSSEDKPATTPPEKYNTTTSLKRMSGKIPALL